MPDEDLGGPWVQAAAFCDRVLIENDGVVSLVRMIDRITVTASGTGPPERMPPTVINTQLFIAFKSGFAKGSQQVGLTGHTPSHKPSTRFACQCSLRETIEA